VEAQGSVFIMSGKRECLLCVRGYKYPSPKKESLGCFWEGQRTVRHDSEGSANPRPKADF
jgi:hypothetical protein